MLTACPQRVRRSLAQLRASRSVSSKVTPKLHISEAVNASDEGGSNTDGAGGDANRLGHFMDRLVILL